MIDAPGTAEGIETVDAALIDEPREALETAAAPDPIETPAVVEVVVIDEPVSPDISRLAQRASTWTAARTQAVADGQVEVRPPAPSNTDLSLLPTINIPAIPQTEEVDAATDESATDETGTGEEVAAESPEASDESEAGSAEPNEGGETPLSATDSASDVAESEGAEPVEESTSASPPAPARVDGRVPPPPGGPTAAQWDALRACESTHNYEAINHTGTYRGAYQFSQQTWDWVAGIHQPHLVGVDPATAPPAWQDIMAYTLYAMRGWDQWPICGQNLL